jgi:hypothetical protein
VEAEDYTAGEINEPVNVECPGRWVGGSQWYMLSYLGPQWGAGPPRSPNDAVAEMTRHIIESEGVVTWDVPIQASGPISEPFVKQLAALKPDGPNQKGRQMSIVELEVHGRERK